jgi:hypothetical protein
VDIIQEQMKRAGVQRHDQWRRARRCVIEHDRPVGQVPRGGELRRPRLMSTTFPTIVLGGTGYVAGELLRLIAGHPNLKLAGVLSDSQPGEPVGQGLPAPAACIRTRYSVDRGRDRAARGDAAAQRHLLGRAARRRRR